MELPKWYGLRYPTLADLEAYAESLGASVAWTRASKACYWPGTNLDSPIIYIPANAGLLERHWSLAHELGHLVLHKGYISPRTRDQQEARAERWAACALIPEQRIRMYGNASEDSMIAALSAHFEDLPLRDCPSRRLAADIARIRLSCLEGVA